MGEAIFNTIQSCRGELAQGFTFPDAKLAILSSAELFGRYQNQHSRRSNQLDHQRRARAQTNIEDIIFDGIILNRRKEYHASRLQNEEVIDELSENQIKTLKGLK